MNGSRPGDLGAPTAAPPPLAPPICRVLVVDDEALVRHVCRITLEPLAVAHAEAENGLEAVQAVEQNAFDLVLLDIDMPVMSGWEVCRRLRQLPGTSYLKIILFSGRSHPDELAEMLAVGADDFLTKPFTPVQLRARVQAALKLKRTQERSDRLYRDLLTVNGELEKMVSARDSDLVEARNALVLGLAKLVECRDSETGAHLHRLQEFSRRLGQEARRHPGFEGKLDENFIELLACCAPLHDIGKVGLPDHILRKPGRLEADERRIMQTHTILGATTLRQVAERHGFALAFLQMSIDIARHHHEHYNGAGYPDKLQGDAIPLAARIVAVCDVYDAMRSVRVYKPAMDHDDVATYIVNAAGTQFDPMLTRCFQACADDFASIYAKLCD